MQLIIYQLLKTVNYKWEKLNLHYLLIVFTEFYFAFVEHSYFRGNRYILDDDRAVMLLFDSNGKIAGIQSGVSTS